MAQAGRPAHVRGVTALVFDGSDGRARNMTSCVARAAAVAPAPVVALFDFPRIEDYEHLLAAGAAGVLSKPLRLEDLVWQLERAIAAREA